MLEHLWHCSVLFLFDPVKMSVASASIIAAIAVFAFLRRDSVQLKWKAAAIYAHLSLLIFPIIFFALTMHCGADCNTPLTNMVLYSLPLTVLFAGFAGFVAIPAFFLRTGSEIKGGLIGGFVKSQSKKMGINAPKTYLAKSGRAVAFSFRSVFSAIFVSEKLLSMLNRKELEAVLLHELAHISSKSSVFKVSAFLMSFSPLSIFKSFGSDLTLEEKKADAFVVKSQKTGKHLLSAKRKMEKAQ
ncbi:MAG: M48 family metalloprotease [Candidatus Aenigmatarchaeota archaeon]